MKITKRQLKRIIKEEKAKLLKEASGQEQENASYALEALLDSYVDEVIMQMGDDDRTVEDERMAFDSATEELERWFKGWLDNMYDQNENSDWDESAGRPAHMRDEDWD